MKHAGPGMSRHPAAESARASTQRQPGRRTTRPRGPNTTGGAGAAWIGAWRLDVNSLGELIAINEDTGAETVLAETEGGD